MNALRTAAAAVAVTALALAGCVTRPVIAVPATLAPIQPFEAAAEPDQHVGAEILWGGSILALENLEASTEVTILAYPLDRAQRPLPQLPTQGRFILVLPGYVERGDYPDGLFVSLNGRISGLREGQVGEHRYVFPLVEPGHVHRWPPGFQFDRPQWHIGIGVGIGIR